MKNRSFSFDEDDLKSTYKQLEQYNKIITQPLIDYGSVSSRKTLVLDHNNSNFNYLENTSPLKALYPQNA